MSEAVRVRRDGHVSGAAYCACSDARPVSESRAEPGHSECGGLLVQCQGSGRGLPSVKLERVTVEVNKVPRLIQVI